MRIALFTLFFLLTASGCKFQSTSELKATPEQKNKLRACIVSTVVEAFPEAAESLNEVNLFASEMVAKAPTQGDGEKDPVFESYVNGLGCDPSKVGSEGNFGLTIVEQWVLSEHNKMAIGPRDSSATVLKKLPN